jgi:hypothetical protein
VIDAAKTSETVELLFDAFDEACEAPDVTLLDALLAVHPFLMCVEETISPEQQREQYRLQMQSFREMYAGALEAFS